MADFVSEFWSWFIAVSVILGLVYCVVLLRGNSASEQLDGKAQTMGHVWDEDLAEYNNPLPKWWKNMFYITIIFSVVYLALYPGLGSFAGFLGWTSANRYEAEVSAAEASYAPLYAGYLATPIAELSKNIEAMGTAKRIFSTNCSICHGSDAGGATGFPNLHDNDWLWGGDEAMIKATITNGRRAAMPAWESIIGESGVSEVSEYVYSLTREPLNPHYVEAGKKRFQTMCIACHGAEGKGNPLLGAPDLTDGTWLYGGSLGAISETVSKGRNGNMPAFNEHLNESQIHLLVAYLNSIQDSNN